MPLEFDSRQTLIIAIFTLFLGKYLNRKIAFFRSYNLPEPVTGGVLVSLIFGGLYFAVNAETSFDLSGRDSLLIVFFTTIGGNKAKSFTCIKPLYCSCTHLTISLGLYFGRLTYLPL